MITTILFDLGGVVLDIDPQKSIEAFQKLELKDVDKLISNAHQEGIFKTFEIGGINEREFLTAIQEQLPEKVEDQEIIDAWNAMLIHLPEERIRLIEELKKSFKVMILSNTNKIHIEKLYEMGAEYTDMSNLFHHKFYSYEMECRKPDAIIYEKVLEQSNTKAENILFLDDNQQNIDTASNLGFQAKLVTSSNDMIKIIKTYLTALV